MKALAGQRSGRVQHGVAEKMDCTRQPRTSISHKLNILPSGSLAACAASTRSSSLVLRRFWAASLTAFAAALSREPRCFSGGIFLSKASGGCMGSYAEVASLPAYFNIILAPPGWAWACNYEKRKALWRVNVPGGTP